MNTPDTGLFAVLNFSLTREEDGRPTQRTATCGTFLQVERAFEVAREEAERELRRRRAESPQPATIIELLDTEWGYDVRQNFLVVSRYWVHDRAPSELGV
ncbi:MAG TPA: hypothetical protein VEA63_11870 [Opitutus sp.]|jgi:hypothetical protein|nr:hypothetical protein [Opitutus sp.]